MDYLISFLAGCAFTLLVVLLTCRDDARPDTPPEPPEPPKERIDTFMTIAPNHLVETGDAPVSPSTFGDVCRLLQRGKGYTVEAMTPRVDHKPLSRGKFELLGGWFVRRGFMIRNQDGTYSPTDDGRRIIHTTVTRMQPARTRRGRGAG